MPRQARGQVKATLALCAVMLSLAAPASTNAASTSPLGHPGRWISHFGRWITDAQDRVVIIHGTNMVYKLPPYFPAAVGFDATDAAFLRSIGFNAVRVGVIWKALEPEPGVYDDSYLDQIASTVDMLARVGILSLLDFHQDMYNEKFQGEGFPDWSVQDEGLPNPQHGFPTNYLISRALQRAFDNFWDNSPGPGGVGLQDRFAAAWRHVAQRFRQNPAVLGYELLNEPWPGSNWFDCPVGCPDFDAKLEAFYRRVDNAIRSVDRKTLVWYEPNVEFNFGYPTSLTSFGPRSGFSFHDYCLTNEAAGCSSHETAMANADQYAADTGDALLMTEWGATSSVSSLGEMVRLSDQHMLSWMHWAYCLCSDPTGALDEGIFEEASGPLGGANLAAPVLDTLVEPYPQLIAGTPRAWSFDRSSRTFRFEYGTRSADGTRRFGAGSLTEIATPALNYPTGYAAHVTGGAIVSGPDAPILQIAACPGATTVAVSVEPSGTSSEACHLGRS